MKSFYLPLAFIAGVSTVAAQDQSTEQMLKLLPKCATGCGLGSTPKTCGPTDVLCACKDRAYLDGIACCMSNKCNEHETEISVKFAAKLCGGVGVKDIPTQATCAATASSTSTASATSSGSSSSASATPSSSGSDNSSSSSSSDSKSGAALTLNTDVPLFVAAGAAAALAFLA